MATSPPAASQSRLQLRQWLEGIGGITAAVGTEEPLKAVLDLVASTATQLLHYEFCAVLLPDPDGLLLRIRGSSGLSSDYVAHVNDVRPVRLGGPHPEEAPSSKAFRLARSVAVSDVETDLDFAPWGAGARAQGYRSMVSVPLRTADGVVGTLNCYHATVHDFDASELDLLEMLATQAAIAITTAKLRSREAETVAELHRLNASLREQHELLQRASAIHEHLTAVALKSGGLRGLVHSLHSLTGLPALIDDARGQQLVASTASKGLPPPALRMAATSPDAAQPDIDLDATTRLGTVVDPSDGASYTVAPVRLFEETVAHLWLPGADNDLEPLQRQAVEHATVVAALELSRERTATEVEWRLKGDLLAELLTGEWVSVDALVERARRMGHDLQRRHVIYVAALEVGSDSSTTSGTSLYRAALAAVAEATSSLTPRPLAAVHRGQLVVLWPEGVGWTNAEEPDRDLAGERLRRTMAAHRRGVSVTLAASAVCSAPEQYTRAYRIARGALELARRSGRADTTIGLSDLGVSGLLLQLDDPEQLLRFADQTLGRLRKYDKRRGSDLLQTLRTYLDTDLSTTMTADRLHVHVNTVGQRLRRIEHLLEVRLANPRDLLALTTAVTLEDIAGGIGSRSPTVRDY